MKPVVLLTTTVSWPAPARLLAAFSVGGCTVRAHCPDDHPLLQSRYLDRASRFDGHRPQESLLQAITVTCPDLIVPCDDAAVVDLLHLYSSPGSKAADIAGLIAKSLGDPESYPTLLSKRMFLNAASGMGIAVPDTILLQDEADLARAVRAIELPAMLKRDRTTGGTGVRVVRTVEEALRLFRSWQSPDGVQAEITLQRLVAGTPATTAFASWRGRVLALISADVLVTERDNGPSSVIRRIDDPDMANAAEKIANRFGLSGLQGLDFVRDRTGKVHLIECNPRATATCYLPFGASRDLPAALAGCLTTDAVPARPSIAGDVVAFFPQEWARDPFSPWLRTAFHDVPRDDPGVRALLQRWANRARLRRRVRDVLRAPARLLHALRDRGFPPLGANFVNGISAVDD
jgi:hypothetical protein